MLPNLTYSRDFKRTWHDWPWEVSQRLGHACLQCMSAMHVCMPVSCLSCLGEARSHWHTMYAIRLMHPVAHTKSLTFVKWLSTIIKYSIFLSEVLTLDISCLENVNKCKTEGRHPSDHLHQQQRRLGCLPFPHKIWDKDFPEPQIAETMRYWWRIAPKALRWENMTPVYEHIWTLLVDACRICSWRQDTAGGAKSWPSAFTNQLYFAGAGHWSSPWLPETGERFTPCSEFQELYDVIYICSSVWPEFTN